jgi:hypothetical protein
VFVDDTELHKRQREQHSEGEETGPQSTGKRGKGKKKKKRERDDGDGDGG